MLLCGPADQPTSIPIVTWVRPLIAHYSVFMVSHSLWDGMLFVLGACFMIVGHFARLLGRDAHSAWISFAGFVLVFKEIGMICVEPIVLSG